MDGGPRSSPRGGKRPRTTSSIFAAAATGILTGSKTEAASLVPPSPMTRSKVTGQDDYPVEALFRLRRHVESTRAAASFAAIDIDNLNGRARKAPSVGGNAMSSTSVAEFSPSTEQLRLRRLSYSREDALAEAEAMAADEGRISPPSPSRTRPLDRARPSGAHRTPSSQKRPVVKATELERSFDATSHGASGRENVDCRPVMAASPIDILPTRDDHGRIPSTAPAFEAPPRNTSKTKINKEHEHALEARRNSGRSTNTRVGQEDQHPSTESCGKGDPDALRRDVSSRSATSPLPRSHHRENRNTGVAGGVCGEEGQLQQADTSSSVEKVLRLSADLDRRHILSAAAKSDASYKSVREDLLQYMEGVRARTSEDGTPSVTFPGNFDRIVGLMDRNDLEDRSPERDAKGASRSGYQRVNARDGSNEAGNKGAGKDGGKELGIDGHTRPWTKYLLEEGLDRTEAFSRYRGMFADEQTGQDRFMRGLAKMKELDLRLARVTGRARELKLQARDAAEQAELAAVGVTSYINEAPLPHPKGRGPVAIEDDSANRPPLRLPLPLSAESAPFGPVSSRVKNASARRTDADSGGDGSTLRLGTERSEISETSGSQRISEGCRGTSRRDSRAKGGRAFVTQNFRGSGRKGPPSNVASEVVSADSYDGTATSQTTAGSGRRKSKSGRQEGGTSARSDGGESAPSKGSRGGRRAARPGRRRLTDEQESLVSRFLEDVDGYNDVGEETGEEPSGVWAEILPYGGVGASEDAARLAAINAKLLEMGGILLSDEEGEGNGEVATQGMSALRRPKAPDATRAARKHRCCVKAVVPQHDVALHPPLPHSPNQIADIRKRWSNHHRSRRQQQKVDTPEGVARDAAEPGDAALREQRAMREARCRERTIDAALEQLRDSLFGSSAAGSQGSREKAVDTALEQARLAPLDMQRGVRRGAGRIDSLLGGEGPQPVGEWEVKHALRQGKEELRGKDLASRERIKELLITVRQESAADSRCVDGPPPQGSGTIDADRFRRGTSLDAFFSLTDNRGASDVEIGCSINPARCVVSPLNADAAATGRERVVLPLEGTMSEDSGSGRGSGERRKQGEDRDPVRGAGIDETLRQDSYVSEATGAPTPRGPAPLPRPRLPRKRKPSVIPPEMVHLFRAPLLVPRHLDPPIAGI
ncbi:unnamed protein product, partial [Scytosiphon promiscuus]